MPMGKPPFQVSLHVAWILITLTHATAHANEEPYCGLYSMHAALKTVGVEPPDFDEFARPEYLSGSQGSTASDLIRLAEKKWCSSCICAQNVGGGFRAIAIANHIAYISSNGKFRFSPLGALSWYSRWRCQAI